MILFYFNVNKTLIEIWLYKSLSLGTKNAQASPASLAGKALCRHVAPPFRAAAPCFWSVREDE